MKKLGAEFNISPAVEPQATIGAAVLAKKLGVEFDIPPAVEPQATTEPRAQYRLWSYWQIRGLG